MLIQTRSTAPKMFAKFEKQTRAFCHKKNGKSDCQTWVRQTIGLIFANLRFWLYTFVLLSYPPPLWIVSINMAISLF